MNKITLLEILKTKPFSFTLCEIEEILDEELNKSPDDMDTELIDLCVDILDKAHSEKGCEEKSKNQKTKKFKAGKALLVAAILILVLSFSFTAGAKFLNIDASEKIVQFVNNHFNVNLGNTNTEADGYSDKSSELINSLKEKGFENIILPSALISEDYSVKITTRSLENIEQATIDFRSTKKDFNGSVLITNHLNNDDNFTIGQVSMSDLYEQVKQITVNGMDVLIFYDGTDSAIYYIDDNMEYHITVNCDFDSAVEIAESIK